MAKAKKTIPKTAAVDKNIAGALDKLSIAVRDGDRAVTARSKTHKKLSAEVKRLAKRKGTLSRRRKLAKSRLKKAPGPDTRKALREVERDLASTTKTLTKARTQKAANAVELAEIKRAYKQANAYAKAVAQADRSLNKKSGKRNKRN